MSSKRSICSVPGVEGSDAGSSGLPADIGDPVLVEMPEAILMIQGTIDRQVYIRCPSADTCTGMSYETIAHGDARNDDSHGA